jgi:PPE-repeat protein
MDFAALPPEINSARMYAGPGSGPMLAAAAAWDGLAGELYSAASSYHSVVSGLADGPWLGPSSVSMAVAAASYVGWMMTAATQAEQTASQARTAAVAYETAYAMTVPPPVIAANRSLLTVLVATNFFGQNTLAIAATETSYAEMWAQDATAMYGYAGTSASAAMLTPFTPPLPSTNPAGLSGQAAAVADAAGASVGRTAQTIISMAPQLLSAAPTALQGLASPLPSAATASTSGLAGILQSLGLTSPLNLFSSLVAPAGVAVSSASLATTSGAAGSASRSSTAILSSQDQITNLEGQILNRIDHLELGPAVGMAGSTGLGASGGTAPFGGLARANVIGGLSVPPGWVTTTPPTNLVAAALPTTSPTTAPQVFAGGQASLFNDMALTGMVRRAVDHTASADFHAHTGPTTFAAAAQQRSTGYPVTRIAAELSALLQAWNSDQRAT